MLLVCMSMYTCTFPDFSVIKLHHFSKVILIIIQPNFNSIWPCDHTVKTITKNMRSTSSIGTDGQRGRSQVDVLQNMFPRYFSAIRLQSFISLLEIVSSVVVTRYASFKQNWNWLCYYANNKHRCYRNHQWQCGPSQLDVASFPGSPSARKRKIKRLFALQAMESWAGPGNEFKLDVLQDVFATSYHPWPRLYVFQSGILTMGHRSLGQGYKRSLVVFMEWSDRLNFWLVPALLAPGKIGDHSHLSKQNSGCLKPVCCACSQRNIVTQGMERRKRWVTSWNWIVSRFLFQLLGARLGRQLIFLWSSEVELHNPKVEVVNSLTNRARTIVVPWHWQFFHNMVAIAMVTDLYCCDTWRVWGNEDWDNAYQVCLFVC